MNATKRKKIHLTKNDKYSNLLLTSKFRMIILKNNITIDNNITIEAVALMCCRNSNFNVVTFFGEFFVLSTL